MKKIFVPLLLISLQSLAQQPKDKGIYVKEPVSYYQHTIVKSLNGTYDTVQHLKFKVDNQGKDFPTNPKLYTTVWHSPKISQGNTGTCWSFSTSSFMESEVFRITGKSVNLSEMYTAYWEYVERTKYFVQHKGDMHLGEGSETNAIAKIMKLYGAVPYSVYQGKSGDDVFYNHEPMFAEIEQLFAEIKVNNDWNEDKAVQKVRAILDKYIGKVPTEFEYEGEKITPKEFLKIIQINPDDYVNFMSLMQSPYYTKTIYDVPDNWWRDSNYNNLPLDDFMALIKSAIETGYSMSIGGDVSEPGFDKISQTAVIPTFDIPSDYIDESARQLRFNNGATTDDHAMHLIGYYVKEGTTWFLIKDSGSGSRNAGEKDEKFGYYFMHEDYVKLKMMTITIHKDGAQWILDKMRK